MWNKVGGNQVGNLALADTATVTDVYETYFEPDVMLPSQFHDIDQDGLVGGERRLMAAILSDGIEAYLEDKSNAVRGLVSSRAGLNVIALKSIRTEAIEWVETVDDSYVFSFDNVCRSLGIEPQYLRLGLSRYVAALLAKSSNPSSATPMLVWKKIRRPRKR